MGGEPTKQKFTKAEKSWMLYDWANSAYSILVAALLPIYAGIVAANAGVDSVTHAADWAWAGSLSALVVAALAPVLGSIADYKNMRMRLFCVFFAVAVFTTLILPAAQAYIAFILLYALTNMSYAGANLFYDAFLVDVTTRERMDKVSSWAYSLGYIGGSTIPFVISIALYLFSSDGLVPLLSISSTNALKLSCVITAVWWAIFTIPFFKNVKQHSFIEPEKHVIKNSLKRINSSVKSIVKNEKALLKFFIAYFFYINGVGAIIMMASKLASTVGFSVLTIVGGLFLTQLIAFPCAILYDKLGERFTHKRMILVGIITYILVSIVGLFMVDEWQFILLACLVGTAQGGIQALSRSFFGKLITDKSRAGEYFGFYNIFGKLESVVGTMLMAIVLMFTSDVHYGVIPVLVLFIVGGVLMLRVPGDPNEVRKDNTTNE